MHQHYQEMDKQEIERWENGCPKIDINEKDRKKGESWMDRQTDRQTTYQESLRDTQLVSEGLDVTGGVQQGLQSDQSVNGGTDPQV